MLYGIVLLCAALALAPGARAADLAPLAEIVVTASPLDRRIDQLTQGAQVLDRAALDRLVAGGFLALADGRLRATAEGRQRLNGVLRMLLG
jgi:oxygen-independent coproporphyrinogen-3 oxidase